MFKHILNRKITSLWLLALCLICSLSCYQRKSYFTELENDLIRAIDSTTYYVVKLNKYIGEEKLKNDELKVLKAKNSQVLLVENTEILKVYLDSIQHKSTEIKDFSDFILQAKTQIDYLNSLNASAKAILKGDSQNFGKWQ